MDPASADRHWDGIYRTKSENELSWHRDEPSLAVDWLMRAEAVARGVVDVGAGTSRVVDRLLESGHHDVTVLDLSASALAQVRDRLGPAGAEVDFQAANVLDWVPSRPYGVWHDRAVFHFLTDPEDQRRYAGVMKSALAEGGCLILSGFALDGPERCSGLPVCRHSPESLLEALGPGVSLLRHAFEDHVTPWGATQRFLITEFAVAARSK